MRAKKNRDKWEQRRIGENKHNNNNIEGEKGMRANKRVCWRREELFIGTDGAYRIFAKRQCVKH